MHIRKLTALTLAVIMLAGCSEIDYSSVASDGSADTSSNGETSVPQASIVTENKTKEYKINKSNFSYVLEAEKTEGTKLISDDRKYSGEDISQWALTNRYRLIWKCLRHSFTILR